MAIKIATHQLKPPVRPKLKDPETERALRDVAAVAMDRWGLSEAVIVHRVGAMVPGEPIVFVAAVSAHRHAALDACAFMIDRLKTDAPFWKRETRGSEVRWVEQRGGDQAAAARWDHEPDESS